MTARNTSKNGHLNKDQHTYGFLDFSKGHTEDGGQGNGVGFVHFIEHTGEDGDDDHGQLTTHNT